MEITKKKAHGAIPNNQSDVDACRLSGSSRSEDDSSTSGEEGEGWLGAFEGGLFEEDEGLEERCREAVAFAARRRETGWRLTHDELYDKAGLGRVDTAMGTIHFKRGQGQQGRAWDCSLVLVKYLESRPEEVRGKGVLELGCGVGLPGVAAAIAGAEQVILTDMAAGLPVIDRTIDLNPAFAGRMSGEVLLWGDEAAAERLVRSRARLPVSVVLCSDLLYGDGPPEEEKGLVMMEKEMKTKNQAVGKRKTGAAEALAITLSAVCSSSSTEEMLILSCHEHRWSGDQGAFFFELLARRGFATVETVDLGDVDERYRGDCGISLLRIRRKRA